MRTADGSPVFVIMFRALLPPLTHCTVFCITAISSTKVIHFPFLWGETQERESSQTEFVSVDFETLKRQIHLRGTKSPTPTMLRKKSLKLNPWKKPRNAWRKRTNPFTRWQKVPLLFFSNVVINRVFNFLFNTMFVCLLIFLFYIVNLMYLLLIVAQ